MDLSILFVGVALLASIWLMIFIKNLSYRYNRKKTLFNGLDLSLKPGGIYGLLGKNGAGKSTLMKSVCGLLFPTEGTCEVFGRIPGKREVAFLENLFFIPEECQLPKLSIDRFKSIYAPFYPAFNGEEFSDYLSAFGITKDAHLQQLSFGQKKKAFIAFGLATNTKLLVMDEPTNGLDIPSKSQFRLLMSKASRPDRIILLSSHQVRDLDDLITAVIMIDNSQILLNEEKTRIAEKLGFYSQSNPGLNEEVIYEERTPAGPVIMCRNTGQQPTYTDLEILFNASLANPSLIRSIFENIN